jgi:ABC-type antimicrobial peptide transport system permease subunit
VRGNSWLLVASKRPSASVLAEIQARVKTIDPDIALTDAKTMAVRVAQSAAPARFRALVTGTLAALTLLLAIVGLHGVVSYAVTQRTRELGVRLALGQRPGAMLREVIFDTLRTVAVGVVPGVMVSNRAAALAGVVAIFVVAALAAAAGPAWRASRVDPAMTLRES